MKNFVPEPLSFQEWESLSTNLFWQSLKARTLSSQTPLQWAEARYGSQEVMGFFWRYGLREFLDQHLKVWSQWAPRWIQRVRTLWLRPGEGGTWGEWGLAFGERELKWAYKLSRLRKDLDVFPAHGLVLSKEEEKQESLSDQELALTLNFSKVSSRQEAAFEKGPHGFGDFQKICGLELQDFKTLAEVLGISLESCFPHGENWFVWSISSFDQKNDQRKKALRICWDMGQNLNFLREQLLEKTSYLNLVPKESKENLFPEELKRSFLFHSKKELFDQSQEQLTSLVAYCSEHNVPIYHLPPEELTPWISKSSSFHGILTRYSQKNMTMVGHWGLWERLKNLEKKIREFC